MRHDERRQPADAEISQLGRDGRLGRAFVEGKAVWHAEANLDVVDPNVAALGELVEKLAPRLCDRLAKGARASDEDLLLYEAVARYFLFQRHDAEWWALITRGEAGERTTLRMPGFAKFAADVATTRHGWRATFRARG